MNRIRKTYSMSTNLTLVTMIAMMLSASGAMSATLLSEDFESPVATDDATVATYSQGTIPTGWVGSTQGFGSSQVGLNSIGTTQVISFRYTNSGLTSGVGAIGALKGNAVYRVTFEVAEDNSATALSYIIGLVVFNAGAVRSSVTGFADNTAGVLAQKSGNAPSGGAFATNTIVYTSSYANASAYVGKDLAVRLDGATTSANYDNITVETLSEDTTAPTIAPADIVAGAASVTAWNNITYTLTFDDWIPAHLLDANTFTNVAATDPVTWDLVSISQVASNVLALTLLPTTNGNLQFQITTNLLDAGLNNLVAAVTDADTVTVAADLTAPTVTSIVDNANSGPVLESSIVTYTVYFDEPVDSNQVTTAVFEDGGTSGASINSVTALPAGVYESYAPSYTVAVTAGSAGTMILQIKAAATIQDRAGNNLVTAAAVPDDTTINVVAPVTQTGTWIADQNGLWSHSPNWQDSNVAYGADSTATLNNITANRTVTLDRDITIGNITAADTTHDFTITGNSLTLDRTAGSPTLNVASNRKLIIGSTIAGNDGLSKTGAGFLGMNGANTFTGGLVIEAGTVGDNTTPFPDTSLNDNLITVNGDCSIGFARPFTTTNGIVLNNQSMLTVAANVGTITVLGPVTGDGGFKMSKLGDGSTTLYLKSTNNTFTGGIDYINIRDSLLYLNSFVDTGTPGAGNIIFSQARADKVHWFILDTGYSAPLILNNRQFAVTDTGEDDSDESIGIRNNSDQAFTINTDLIMSGSGGAKRFKLGGTGSGTNTFAGNITNGVASYINLIKEDSNIWILSGQNSYTGTTTVSGGTLVLRGEASIADTGTLNITSGKVEIETREAIAVLQINGTPVASGIWGTTSSGAPNINNVNLSGTGKLYVGEPFPPAGTVFIIK